MHDDKKVSLSHKSQDNTRISSYTAAAVSTFRLTEWPDFSSSGVWELEAQEEAASPDRDLPMHTTETYPIACGLPFEGACLFLTFLVNLPWEHWNPSSWSKVRAQTVWDGAEDRNHFNVI